MAPRRLQSFAATVQAVFAGLSRVVSTFRTMTDAWTVPTGKNNPRVINIEELKMSKSSFLYML
jgi:hypothetical protein